MPSDYYAILGVAHTATPEEIKNSFHKLSLKHHPDKGGDPEVFKVINEAHQVLSDPSKRNLYDTVGEDGMKLYDGINDDDSAGIVGVLGCLVCFGCCAGPLFSLQFIFIPLSLNNDVDWSATTTLIPSFILDGFLGLLALTFSCALKNRASREELSQRIASWVIIFRILSAISASIAFRVLLVQKIDDDKNTWKIVFAPLVVFYGFEVLRRLFKTLATIYTYSQTAKYSNDEPMSFTVMIHLIFNSVAAYGLQIAFFVLTALKKDNEFDGSWYVVIAPLWALLGLMLFTTAFNTMNQNETSCFPAFCSSSFIFAPFIIFIGLVAAKSEGEDYSWHQVFAPIYVMVVILNCITSAGSSSLGKKDEAKKEDETSAPIV